MGHYGKDSVYVWIYRHAPTWRWSRDNKIPVTKSTECTHTLWLMLHVSRLHVCVIPESRRRNANVKTMSKSHLDVMEHISSRNMSNGMFAGLDTEGVSIKICHVMKWLMIKQLPEAAISLGTAYCQGYLELRRISLDFPSSLNTFLRLMVCTYPDSEAHGANMGPTWVLSAPGGPHVGLMNLAIGVVTDLLHNL